jgi:formate dehydrogenase major subunit
MLASTTPTVTEPALQGNGTTVEISLDGAKIKAHDGEWLVDAITREKGLPHICYHPRLGPIQTCDTCMVEVDGTLTRACSTPVHTGLTVVTESPLVRQAQLEAMDVILGNHMLYCTVCDNNNNARSAITTTKTVPCITPLHF